MSYCMRCCIVIMFERPEKYVCGSILEAQEDIKQRETLVSLP